MDCAGFHASYGRRQQRCDLIASRQSLPSCLRRKITAEQSALEVFPVEGFWLILICMSEFSIPYGRTKLTILLNGAFQTELLAPARAEPVADPPGAVREALDSPLGGARLADFAHARSVAIAINDKTRPVPHAVLLPPLLHALEGLGIAPGAITLVVATGLHAPMPEAEFVQILPADILARYRVISHDAAAAADLISLGKTRLGTPVQVNRLFGQADLRVVVGNLEPHQFMGFSGGVKTAAIGLGGRDTINQNHALMLDPRSDLARYDDNPARQDVEEAGRMIGIHFALNAVIMRTNRLCVSWPANRRP